MSVVDSILAKFSDPAREEFNKAIAGMKLADLSTGDYVGKGKDEGELAEANKRAAELQK